MTPGARLAAAIEILDRIAGDPRPADRIVTGELRRRRYAGSKDRAAINRIVYGTLRRRARLGWWLVRHALDPNSARALAIAELMLGQGASDTEVSEMLSGAGHSAAPAEPDEAAFITAVSGSELEPSDMPEDVRLECPEWLYPDLVRDLGDASSSILEALRDEAPFDLRVNPRDPGKGTRHRREQAVVELAAAGITVEPTTLSPIGLRASARRPIDQLKAYRDGRIEVQDEGSQLAALMLDARPGMQVADFCAGGGGKALVAAAMMRGKGRVLAMDVSEARLTQTAERAKRADLHNIERMVLASETDPALVPMAKEFDRVLVDAPCSGSGTWRRNPGGRWRLTADDLTRYADLQDRILSAASRLVRPGGRLVYVTCALSRRENEDRVEAFMTHEPDFQPLPVYTVWQETLEPLGTPACPSDGNYLRLDPHHHGTDSFFVAVLERKLPS